MQTRRKQEYLYTFKSWNIIQPLKSMTNKDILTKKKCLWYVKNQSTKPYVQYILNSYSHVEKELERKMLSC